MPSSTDSIFDERLSDQARTYLLETARWTKFLAALGFLVIGIMAVVLLAFIITGAVTNLFSAEGHLTVPLLTGLFASVFMFSVYWYPTLMLYRFSRFIKTGIAEGNQELITRAFRCQRNFFKFCGIIVLIFLSLYVLIFAFSALSIFS